MRRGISFLVAGTICVALGDGQLQGAFAFSPPGSATISTIPSRHSSITHVPPSGLGYNSWSPTTRILVCGERKLLPVSFSRATEEDQSHVVATEYMADTSTTVEAEPSAVATTSISSGTTKGNSAGLNDAEETTADGYTLILALCFFVTVLSALDRVAMSVALLPMSTEFQLTDTVKGQISSVFSVGYGLAILPCGLLVAAASPRLIMAAGVALWSAATIGSPLAAGLIVSGGTTAVDAADAGAAMTFAAENVAPLLVIRAIMGGAESVVLPAVQRILANWVPPSKKSFAVASVLSGFQVGTVIAYLISPVVIDEFGGWRGMFFLYGAIGVLWLLPWLAFAKDVPSEVIDIEHNIAEEETVLINTLRDDDISLVPEHAIALKRGGGGGEMTSASEMVIEPELPSPSTVDEAVAVLKEAPWKELATSKAVWAMAIAHAANNWGLYINLSWGPTFYAEQYGLSIKDSALLSILPSVAGAAGGLLAGSSADYIIERIGGGVDERTTVRKTFQAIALIGPALCLFALATEMPSAPFAAQLLLTGAIGMQAFNCAGYGAATQEKASRWAGLLYSVTSLPGVIFGSFGVALTGDILDKTGQDWSSVFSLVAFVDVVGALAFIILYNSRREFE